MLKDAQQQREFDAARGRLQQINNGQYERGWENAATSDSKSLVRSAISAGEKGREWGRAGGPAGASTYLLRSALKRRWG